MRAKRCLLAGNPKLREVVAGKLVLDWSPEQISGWLKTQYPDDESMRVSHETIYRSLFIQARGVLKQELRWSIPVSKAAHAPLAPCKGQRTVPRWSDRVEAVLRIRSTCEAEDRAVPGHWEGDLLSGSKNSYIATLVERHSRFAMLIKVPGKDTEAVVQALSRQVRKLPASLRRSLTWGLSRIGDGALVHKEFTVATNVKVYFCDPQVVPGSAAPMKTPISCWRQYFP